MASSNSSSGVYIPSTQVWDVSEIHNTDVTKPEFKELLVRMYQNLNSMSMAISNKESSFYSTLETVKGQAFNARPGDTSTTTSNPESRQVFNKVIEFGALPNAAGTKSVAHGIAFDVNYVFTRIYGASTNPVGLVALPLPYYHSVIGSLSVTITATNVVIVSTFNATAYTTSYIVLEYMKC